MTHRDIHNQQLLHCEICGGLSRLPERLSSKVYCPRCGAALHTPDYNRSIQVTWALLIASIILFIPANTLPVMSFYIMGKGSPATIVAGVIQLVEYNQWPVALLIFFASIVVPLAKIIVIAFLLISIQWRSHWRPQERVLLYRIVEYIGRWSMVDVFVVAVLVGVVQFGNLAYVEANIGTLSFAAVVILTMLAARTLDPHLIWAMMNKEKIND